MTEGKLHLNFEGKNFHVAIGFQEDNKLKIKYTRNSNNKTMIKIFFNQRWNQLIKEGNCLENIKFCLNYNKNNDENKFYDLIELFKIQDERGFILIKEDQLNEF